MELPVITKLSEILLKLYTINVLIIIFIILIIYYIFFYTKNESFFNIKISKDDNFLKKISRNSNKQLVNNLDNSCKIYDNISEIDNDNNSNFFKNNSSIDISFIDKSKQKINTENTLINYNNNTKYRIDIF